MGFIRFIGKSLLQGIFIFFLVTLMPGLPPYVQFTEFRVTEPLPLDGPLTENTLLNNAEQLYSGKLHGPEALAEHKGVLYSGLHGGEVVKFVDGKIIPVVKFGEPCEGFWEEEKCGRPLGMKFGPDGFLYVADAYYGLFKVNLKTGAKTLLGSANEPIDGKVPKLPNSVDVADDGTVYWTTSSCNFKLSDGVFDFLGDGSGRLLKYDPKTKKNEVLIEDLHFANGVVLSPKEDFVLVAETVRSRIHRYYLKGPKKGTHDIFIDGLPGAPDNLRSDGQGGFLVPLVAIRDKNYPLLFQSLGPFPLLRKFFARVLALLEMSFEQINNFYPNYYTKRAVHWIGHFESLSRTVPKRVIILQLDVDGKIKHSYHSTDGSLSGICDAHWFNGAFYLGSPYNNYLGRVKLSFAEPHSQNAKSAQQTEQPKQKVQEQQKSTPPPSQPKQKPPPSPPPPPQQQKAPQQQQQQQQRPPQQQQQPSQQQAPPQERQQAPPQQHQQAPPQRQQASAQQQQQKPPQQQQTPPQHQQQKPSQQQQQSKPPPQQQTTPQQQQQTTPQQQQQTTPQQQQQTPPQQQQPQLSKQMPPQQQQQKPPPPQQQQQQKPPQQQQQTPPQQQKPPQQQQPPQNSKQMPPQQQQQQQQKPPQQQQQTQQPKPPQQQQQTQQPKPPQQQQKPPQQQQEPSQQQQQRQQQQQSPPQQKQQNPKPEL